MTARILAVAALAAAAALAAGCGGDGQAPAGQDAPPVATDGSSSPSAGAPIPGGGLSIEEAIASTLPGPLMVKGYLVAPAGEPVRLCSALLESYPPQCGEPALVVEGLDLDSLEGLTSTDDPSLPTVTWSDQEISILGDVADGVVSVAETSI